MEARTTKIEPSNAPPPFGELNITLPIVPASLQARSAKKQAVIANIREVTSTAEYLLSGDVKVEIEWTVHEQARYESDETPDVDNIIKPILDALSGPDGILINDCQVQAVSCHWVDWTRSEQQVQIRIRFFSDEWCRKAPLMFVHLGRGLCMPLSEDLPNEALEIFLDCFENMLPVREKLLDIGADYYAAQGVMSVQRVFHRSRLGGFTVVEVADLRKRLEPPDGPTNHRGASP